MASITAHQKDFLPLYKGFDTTTVGLGAIDPNIYSDKKYQQKKKQQILIGGLSELVYSGFEHDMKPKVIVMGYEPQYNTVIGINLNYGPEKVRHAIIKLIFRSNKLRIKQQKPLIIDYKMLEKVVPQVKGMIRRYKVVGIKVLNSYPLNEWETKTKGASKWQAMYRNPAIAKKKYTTQSGLYTRTRTRV